MTHRLERIMVLCVAAVTGLTVTTGCTQHKNADRLPLSEQFSRITAQSHLTEFYGGSISTRNLVVLHADYEGRPAELSLDDDNNLQVYDWKGASLEGKRSIQNFDISLLEPALHNANETSDNCRLVSLHFDFSPTGSQIQYAYCFPVGRGGEDYIVGSSVLDGESLVEGPDVRNPDHVAQLARVYDKMLPGGVMVDWTLSFGRPENQDAYGPKTTNIQGETCMPTMRSSATEITTYNVGCSGLPAYNEQPFHLSNFDPNLVNIVADRLAEAGIDINQAMTLDFYSQDGTNLTYKLTTFQASGVLNPATTGTIAPTK